jgi:hypothetical protein
MKYRQNNMIKAAMVLTLSIAFIASSSITTATVTVNTPRFSSTTTSTTPSNVGRDEHEIRYYDPATCTQVIGIENVTVPYKWQSAIRLTQDELAPYKDWNLTKVNAGYSADNGQLECYATVIIYDKGDATHPGAVLSNDTTYHFDISGIATITLNTPLPLASYEEIWVAIEWEQTETSAYLAFMDEGPAVDGKGDWGFDGAWSELQIYGLDGNWAIGAIVEGQGNTELSLLNFKGSIGITADVKNIGQSAAQNVQWSITVTGGILKKVNVTTTGSVANLAVDASEAINQGMFLGLWKIQIVAKAHADNAAEVAATKTAYLFGPFVLGIK